MRLGDLDALKKEFKKIYHIVETAEQLANAMEDAIDNAPTLEANSIIDGLNNEIDDLSENLAWYINERNRLLKERRPQGKWRERMKEHFREASEIGGDMFHLSDIERILDGEDL